LKDTFTEMFTGFAWLLFAVVALAIVVSLLNWYVNESGWMPRAREVNVYFHSWITGELKRCHSLSTAGKEELTSLFCANEINESHTFRVKFWGTITTDRDRIWKCEREEASVSCKPQEH
jgi:hypothetical protein